MQLIRRLALLGTLAGLLVSLAATPAQAQVLERRGYECYGSEVRRCAWINVDLTNNRIRGYVAVRDADGGRNWGVAVNEVRIQVREGGAWRNIGATNPDHDGWHGRRDPASTALLSCGRNHDRPYRVIALFHWRVAGTNVATEQRQWSGDVLCAR